MLVWGKSERGVVVGGVTGSCRKESRLVLRYPVYYNYSCDYCAFIVGNVSILRLRLWLSYIIYHMLVRMSDCLAWTRTIQTRSLCADVRYDVFYRFHTKS